MSRPAPARSIRRVLLGGTVASIVTAALVTTTVAQSPTPVAPVAPTGEVVRLLTHGSFALSDDVLASFTTLTGATIQVLEATDAGSAVNQAILTKSNPVADVLYGVDDTFLSRALDAGIFEAYQPAAAAAIPAELQLDPTGQVTPIDYGDVCINIDLQAFAALGIDPPATLEDLTDPAYRDMLVVEDPGLSSPGLAFLLATIERFGESGDRTWLDFWADLRANGVQVESGWEAAYYGGFSGGAGEGDRPLVVSYASSPVAEVFYAEPQPTEAPTASMTDGCYRQVEFAGVLAGTQQPELARALVDFLLSEPVQEDIPLNMFVYPALPTAQLPEVFQTHTAVPAAPVTMDPARIAAGRDAWIEAWTQTVLR
ncbi:MAG: thiamine ABC transporter substrate-binding protein [Chloroflexi bacterium]|nr:thiamine ABC transporter substrate-binding protein [Chloroflexota bacterium]